MGKGAERTGAKDADRQRDAQLDALLRPVLHLGDRHLLRDMRRGMQDGGIAQAAADRDTPTIFDWMIALFQLQGMSDANAFGFSARHGAVGWTDLGKAARQWPSCPRLISYWAFADCGFRRHAWTCAEPGRIDGCPLPRLPLRNGRLSQSAFAFYLFVRDVCERDLVGWIDKRLEDADRPSDGREGAERARRLRAALLGPLTAIHGIGDKVASMVLADLLLGADPHRERWVTAGAGMIAVDTLVHNFLHRTEILAAHDAEHPYGASCYAPGGCADIIESFAGRIDARSFGEEFPVSFPRFVQHAIWRFCAADGWNICNGNRIDDRRSCEQLYCPIGRSCRRRILRPEPRRPATRHQPDAA